MNTGIANSSDGLGINWDQERDAEKKCGGAVGGTVLGVGSAPTELNEPVSYKTRKP